MQFDCEDGYRRAFTGPAVAPIAVAAVAQCTVLGLYLITRRWRLCGSGLRRSQFHDGSVAEIETNTQTDSLEGYRVV